MALCCILTVAESAGPRRARPGRFADADRLKGDGYKEQQGRHDN
jgi:hypothetical protein